MHIERLNDLTGEMELWADVIVIGGGPTGITIAKELARSGTEVLLLESGLQAETSAHTALNKVENVGELQDAAQIEKRSHFC